MLAVHVALFALACVQSPTAEATWVDQRADDTWSVEGADGPGAPQWTAEEVGARIDLATSLGIPEPLSVLAVYTELLSHGDDACPGGEFAGGFVTLEGCTSEQGYRFAGSAGLAIEDERAGEGDDWTGLVSLASAPADYVITRPDGRALEVGGIFRLVLVRAEGQREWRSRLAGTYVDPAAGGWLAPGFSGALQLAGVGEGAAAVQTADGSLGVLGVAIDVSQLVVAPGVCADGFLGGVIRVRQDDATWNVVSLPGECSRCGSVSWEGVEELGEACIDPSPWFASIDDVQSW